MQVTGTRHRACHSHSRSQPRSAPGWRGSSPSQSRCSSVYVVDVHFGE
ncbi:hypothetical protein [Nocardioides sp. GXQ0305]